MKPAGRSRREVIFALGGLLASCSTRRETSASSTSEASQLDQAGLLLRDISLPDGTRQGGSERAVLLVPKGVSKPPVLIALHGRGEAVRGAEVGAYGWLRSYHVERTVAALAKGRLGAADLQNHVEPARLARLNEGLAREPYEGVALLCPHLPDLTGQRNLDAGLRYGDWLVSTLLPRARGEASLGAAAGIDGVSLGGRIALLAGLSHPETFMAVGALQPAINDAEQEAWVARAKSYLERRPDGRVRLVTSTADYFRPAVEGLGRALSKAGVAHELLTVVGPHDYSFNEGPGGVEMLRFHDRVLRGKQPS